METISIKLDKSLANKIDFTLFKHKYTTKTEFIREAIRDKIKELEREELIMKTYGASKRKTTDEQIHIAGEKAFKELERKFNKL